MYNLILELLDFLALFVEIANSLPEFFPVLFLAELYLAELSFQLLILLLQFLNLFLLLFTGSRQFRDVKLLLYYFC